MSGPGAGAELLPIVNGHLWFIQERPAQTCIVCHELLNSPADPLCGRCGLRAFHLQCYIDAIARGRRERRFWATRSARVAEALARFTPFLCPGCRS